MEEKLIMQSQRYNVKKLFLIICVIGLIVGLIVSAAIYVSDIMWDLERLEEYTQEYEATGSTYARENMQRFQRWLESDIEYACIMVVIPLALALIIGGIVYSWLSKIELTVTDKRVYGKAAFGKRVDLPLDSVSAVGSGWPKGIAVSTSSGKIAFLAIKNRDNLHKCISNLLIERQSKAAPVAAAKPEIPQSNADELKKYKDLLDSGVITQEEFDAKKKQLLGI